MKRIKIYAIIIVIIANLVMGYSLNGYTDSFIDILTLLVYIAVNCVGFYIIFKPKYKPKKYRVGFYNDRVEDYFYFDNEIEAYEQFINKRQEGETWYDKRVKEKDGEYTYETIETYYPEDDVE